MYFEVSREDRKHGAELIAGFVKNAPNFPGVYRMIDKKGKVLYVGKAKNIAKRLANYTDLKSLSNRIQSMVGKTADVEIVITKSEAEAFLLEANLIKHFQPRYNILLKDDKSFPYILIRQEHDYNQITKHRGNKKEKGLYFGPFASAKDVNHTINYLQKIFLIRPCSDSYFASRARPCIQYDIKRCSAPCVSKINLKDYQALINQACDFLNGKTDKVKNLLVKEMEELSASLKYEKASVIRDRIKALNTITANQLINSENIGNIDVIGIWREYGKSCIQIFFFRGGQNFGNKSYFPQHSDEDSDIDIIIAFLGRFYQTNIPPQEIIIPVEFPEMKIIESLLNQNVDYKVSIKYAKQGDKAKLLEVAMSNAKEALDRKIKGDIGQNRNLEEVAKLFHMKKAPSRIEVYDNSHIMGKFAVGAMIVANSEGLDKNSYRKYNITGTGYSKISGGDDYQMMREVITRRLKRLIESGAEEGDEAWPDLMIIDGGKAHLGVVHEIIKEFQLVDKITLVSIAKGPERNAGKEYFFQKNHEEFTLPRDLPVMKYLQILRDEAHKFAITTHRAKRALSVKTSILDKIPGVGPKRRKEIINYFGSVDKLAVASLSDIEKIPKINKRIAENIYLYLHPK